MFGVLAPFLSVDDLKEIQRIQDAIKSDTNLEAAEKSYHRITQKQILSDLLTLYDEKNASRLQITFASFTPDGPHRPMGDFGFGLHVVKRLTIDLPGGETKVIEVNEEWAEDRSTGGLFAPDELRVKTRVIPGPRFVEGSEAHYLYDILRVAWGPEAKSAKIVRRTRFTFHDGKNLHKRMRVPVSSPYLCKGCHESPTTRAKRFLQPGEKVNHEAIVQDSQFRLPPLETLGVREYVKHLEKSERPETFIARVKKTLATPHHSLRLPALLPALREMLDSETSLWLGDDLPHAKSLRQGAYLWKNEVPMLDAIENVIPGKYSSWTPLPIVPR